MGDIILKKLSPAPVYTYHIRNLIDLSIDLEVPVIIYQIPTSPDDDAIGIKVDGNKSVVNISWTLVDEGTTVVDGLTIASTIKTADEQMAFLLTADKTTGKGEYNAETNVLLEEGMQPTGIDFSYELKLMPNTGSTPFFKKEGIITRINVSKSGDTPVTYRATITFATADMQEAIET
jgi:hypothetical protein